MPSAWAYGEDLVNDTAESGGFGDINGAINAGGYDGSAMEEAEEFDGSSWSLITSLPGQRHRHGAVGTPAAGLVVGGYYIGASPDELETCKEWDGTTWSAGGSLTQESSFPIVFGTPTATFKTCGTTNVGGNHLDTEEYDGSAWSAGVDFPADRNNGRGLGSQSDGLVVGGWNTDATLQLDAQEWNGTSWSTGGDLTNGTLKAGLFGATNDCIYAGGQDPNASYQPTDICEEYDGSSFSAGVSLIIKHQDYGAANNGTKPNAFFFGGVTRDTVTHTNVITSQYYSYEPGPGDPCFIFRADSISVDDVGELKDLPLVGTVVYGQTSSYDEDNGEPFLGNWTGGVPSGSDNSEVMVVQSGVDAISKTVNIGTGSVVIEQNKYGTGEEGTAYYRTGATEVACDAAGWTEYTGAFTSLGFITVKISL